MPTRRVNLTLEEEFIDLILQHKPRSLALSAFCGLLLEEALTGSVTYPRAVLVRETTNIPVNNAGSSGSSQTAVKAVEEVQKVSSSNIELFLGDGVGKELEETPRQDPSLSSKPRKKTVCSDEFQAFWKLYQSCPNKASNQRKNKAWDEWRSAIQLESPARLMKALEESIALNKRLQNTEGWAAPLPDCFRWLRDGCYTAALEEASQTSQTSQSGRITFLS